MYRYWFGDIEDRESRSCVRLSGGETVWITRFFQVISNTIPIPPAEWEDAAQAGIVRTREEYLHYLRKICICGTQAQLAERTQRSDLVLIEMVRGLDEIDRVLNRLQERAHDWSLSLNLHYPPGTAPGWVQDGTNAAFTRPGKALEILQNEIQRLQEARRSFAKEVRAMAEQVLPNSSVLVGGLVAARLLSEAGDLPALARMPASTLQVIGARKALFSHLQTGTSSPRHGIIFQDKKIHNAPRRQRGKMARTVACAVARAVKLDFFRGEMVPEFLSDARARIAKARGGK
ncbi:MAG: RNA-processing protein [Methanomicrobiales archaeon]|nr:RNA-processing protein [Methanomicrobiales archaeon]